MRKEIKSYYPSLLLLSKPSLKSNHTDSSIIAVKKGQLNHYFRSLVKSKDVLQSEALKNWLDPSNDPTHNTLSKTDKVGYMYLEDNIHKVWEKFWFVLLGSTLYYFNDDTTTTLVGVIELNERVVREVHERDKKYCFELNHAHNTKATLFFNVENEKEYNEWIQILKSESYEKCQNNQHTVLKKKVNSPVLLRKKLESTRKSSNNSHTSSSIPINNRVLDSSGDSIVKYSSPYRILSPSTPSPSNSSNTGSRSSFEDILKATSDPGQYEWIKGYLFFSFQLLMYLHFYLQITTLLY